ncbi:hypothetical protein C2E31_10365 [Rhodopirellula baltica]|nr:hypothetical protein C2E31_10365 [Rhodopirellula baltica]
MMKIPIRQLLPLLLLAVSTLPAGAEGNEESGAEIDTTSQWITSIDSLGDSGFVAGTATGLLLRPSTVVKFEGSDANHLQELYQHPAAVWTVATPADGKTIASADYQGNLIVYDVEAASPNQFDKAFERWCQKIAFAPDGKSIVAGNESGKLYVWDLAESKVSKSQELSKASITCLAISPSGEQLAASDGEGKVHLLSWPQLESVGVVSVGEDTAWSVAYENDTTLLVGSSDRNLYRVEAKPDATPSAIAKGSDWITRIAISPSGQIAAAEVSGKVHVMSEDSPTTLSADSGVWALEFGKQGCLMVGTRKNGVAVAKQSWTFETPGSALPESGSAEVTQ